MTTPGVYPPSRSDHSGWPNPLMVSITTQAHARGTADRHSRRTGQIKHQRPNVTSEMLNQPLTEEEEQSLEDLNEFDFDDI